MEEMYAIKFSSIRYYYHTEETYVINFLEQDSFCKKFIAYM